jgi:hypothetical protein
MISKIEKTLMMKTFDPQNKSLQELEVEVKKIRTEMEDLEDLISAKLAIEVNGSKSGITWEKASQEFGWNFKS